jgi:hypothetical protein
MARIGWAVVCTGASLDVDSKNLTLFEILDQIQIEGTLPPTGERVTTLLALRLALVSLWRKEPDDDEEIELRMVVHGPSGEEKIAPQQQMKINFASTPRARHILRMDGLPYLGIGTYNFVLQRKEANSWIDMCEVPLEVGHVPVAREQQAR